MLGVIQYGFMLALIIVGLIGIYEYYLYDVEERRRVKATAKMYLMGMVVLILVGVGGLIALSFGVSLIAVWPGFLFLFLLSLMLVLIQHRMHRRMRIEKSPLRQKFGRSE